MYAAPLCIFHLDMHTQILAHRFIPHVFQSSYDEEDDEVDKETLKLLHIASECIFWDRPDLILFGTRREREKRTTEGTSRMAQTTRQVQLSEAHRDNWHKTKSMQRR